MWRWLSSSSRSAGRMSTSRMPASVLASPTEILRWRGRRASRSGLLFVKADASCEKWRVHGRHVMRRFAPYRSPIASEQLRAPGHAHGGHDSVPDFARHSAVLASCSGTFPRASTGRNAEPSVAPDARRLPLGPELLDRDSVDPPTLFADPLLGDMRAVKRAPHSGKCQSLHGSDRDEGAEQVRLADLRPCDAEARLPHDRGRHGGLGAVEGPGVPDEPHQRSYVVATALIARTNVRRFTWSRETPNTRRIRG
jgi:hypothetical protein